MTFRHHAFGGVLALTALGSFAAASCRTPEHAPREPARGSLAREHVAQNVSFEDYAGSASCAPCHANIARAFEASPMRRMTRTATKEAIRAPFAGESYTFKDDRVQMELHGDRRYLRIDSPRGPAGLYQITKVIGGRYREDYVGRRVARVGEEPEPSRGGDERVLPISWLLFENSWRYKGYSVMATERPHLAPGAKWRTSCIFCHNTVPALASLYDDLDPSVGTYQGSVSDKLLPPPHAWRYEVTDEPALLAALSSEIERLGARLPEDAPLDVALEQAVKHTRSRFDEEHLIELGVGCESCHNGAREHVENPSRKPSFEPKSPFLRLVDAEGSRGTAAEYENRACARCHTVLFSRYPWTWEGQRREQAQGGSNINSGEARDYLLGGCASQMTCSTCHDPHGGSPRERLDALGTTLGNTVCTTCHEDKETEEQVRAHTHHAPQGTGSACLNCHMPQKNMGLAYELTRYHRIGSPNDPERVERDRPLECALCHADASVESLARTMEEWWGGSFDRARLRQLYGSLDARPLLATVERGKPHERVTAAVSLSYQGQTESIDALVPLLWHEIPLARFFARRALERLSGAPVDIDVEADVAQIQEAAKKWRLAQKRTLVPGAPDEAPLSP